METKKLKKEYLTILYKKNSKYDLIIMSVDVLYRDS